MFKVHHISEKMRTELENQFKKQYPKLILEYSPAFKHYYVFDPKTKEKTDNISAYELYDRLIIES